MRDSMVVRSMAALTAGLLFVVQAHAGSFAQLSSTENQAADTKPKMVALDATDAAKGIENSKGTITLKDAGTYFVMAAGQVGSSTKGKGSVKLWMRQNDKDIDNSNTEQSIDGDFTAVLVCQGIVEAKAGDKLTLMFSANKTGQGLGLVASKPKGEPAIPSMIFSACRVNGAYAQLSSPESQAAGSDPKALTLSSTDAAKGIENVNGTIVVKEAGTYFVLAAGQAGAVSDGGMGTVRLWLRQNGKDVDNSNTEQTVGHGSTAVVVSQGLAELKAGDKLQLVQAATGKGVGMVASTPKGESAIPSMIFTTFKVDGAYAQLSSSETQAAGSDPKAITLDATDGAKGIENSKGTVTVKDAGTYFVVGAGQAGATSEGGKGNVRLWLRQNGKDVDNSNTEQTISGGYTAVLVSQGVAELKAGDKLQLAQSATGKGVGMVASKPKGESAVPSMIFSAFRVD